jgi:hypothetical protein
MRIVECIFFSVFPALPRQRPSPSTPSAPSLLPRTRGGGGASQEEGRRRPAHSARSTRKPAGRRRIKSRWRPPSSYSPAVAAATRPLFGSFFSTGSRPPRRFELVPVSACSSPAAASGRWLLNPYPFRPSCFPVFLLLSECPAAHKKKLASLPAYLTVSTL